jgi:protein-S-isoprenylcysteine O-methyltransferase Ste14
MTGSKLFLSLFLVGIQFACLAGMALTGPLIPDNSTLLAFQLAGFGLGIWAVFSMRIGYFNILPQPLSWSRLVTSGPYKYIRHPMYLALLLLTLPLILDTFNFFRLGIWLLLLVDLLLKLSFEEKLLQNNLDGYDRYIQKSFRLVPFFY